MYDDDFFSTNDDFLDSITETVYVETPPNFGLHWRGEDVFWMSFAAIALFLGMVIAIIIAFVLMIPDAATLATDPSTFISPEFTILSLIVSVLALVSVMPLIGFRRRKVGWESVGIKPASFASITVSFLVGVVYVPVNLFIVTVVLSFFGVPAEDILQQSFSLGEEMSLPLYLVLGLFVAFLVPIAEELFFRGVLYDWLRGRWGIAIGIIVSSIVFGILHVNPGSIVSISILGAMCAYAYQRTDSIYTAIAIHSGNNTVVVVVGIAMMLS